MNSITVESHIAELSTEQRNPKSIGIASLPTLGILETINDFDQTVATRVRAALPVIERAVSLITERLEAGGRLVYTGAGTSGRLGIMDAAECSPTYGVSNVMGVMAGGRDAVFKAREMLEDERNGAPSELESIGLSPKDVLFAVAASGRTPYCIGALEYAKKTGAGRISLACNKGAVISGYAEVAIEIDTGPEVIMGSTRMKAGTAEKLVMNMVSTAVMIKLGRTYDNLMIKLHCQNHKGLNRTLRLFREATGINDLEYARNALGKSDGRLEIAVLVELTGAQKENAEQALETSGGNFTRALTMLKK